MRLGHLRPAVVGVYVTVHVEHSERVRVGSGVAVGQGGEQLGGPVPGGEGGHAPAQGLRLWCPVEAQQPAEVDGVDAGEALGPGFAHQRSEHDGEHQTAQPVEGGPGPTVGRLDAVEQARDRQSRQHDQRPGQRQRRPRGDAGLGLGQLAAPSRLTFGLPGFGAGQRLEPAGAPALAAPVPIRPAPATPSPHPPQHARRSRHARTPRPAARVSRPPSPRSAWRAHGGRAARGRAPPPRRRGTPGASATGSHHRCRRRQPPRRRGPRPPRSAAPPPAAGPPHPPAANTTSPSPTRTPRHPRPTRPGPPHSTRARTRKGRPAPASDNPCPPPLRLPPPPPPRLTPLQQLWTARSGRWWIAPRIARLSAHCVRSPGFRRSSPWSRCVAMDSSSNRACAFGCRGPNEELDRHRQRVDGGAPGADVDPGRSDTAGGAVEVTADGAPRSRSSTGGPSRCDGEGVGDRRHRDAASDRASARCGGVVRRVRDGDRRRVPSPPRPFVRTRGTRRAVSSMGRTDGYPVSARRARGDHHDAVRPRPPRDRTR